MKRFLPLLGVAALIAATPVHAQYVYLDTNGDGVCDFIDVITSSVSSVGVYFDTNHHKDGSLASCPDANYQLTINSFEIILHAAGTGSLTYGAFTNLMNAFTFQIGPEGAGGNTDYHIGFGGSTALPPGLYKVGTLAITVTGIPRLEIATSTTLNSVALTSFGSQCPGQDFDNTMKLGLDFMDACGPAYPTDAKITTWGAIKNRYR